MLNALQHTLNYKQFGTFVQQLKTIHFSLRLSANILTAALIPGFIVKL
jgi:hypothetical protein